MGKENPAFVEALFQAGADPNVTSTADKMSPLMMAANRKLPQSFQLLLIHGANVNQRDADGDTALWYTAWYGNADMVERLLKAGADVNTKGKDGRTALHVACEGSRTDNIEVFLRHHADINARDRRGVTPLDDTDDPALQKRLRKAGAKTGAELEAEK